MAYATIIDIERLMAQFPITAIASRPSTSQVDVIIAQISAEINVHLAAAGVLAVPIVTPPAPAYFVEWLTIVNSYGATAAVLKSMFPGAIGPDETPAYAFWESRYRAALKGIDDGSLLPDDPGLVNTGKVTPSTYFTRNPDAEENLGQIAEPFFRRSQTF